ncbi:hypothetical protein AB0368_04385 [Actinoplanes sp. NPDC051475]|uniref:hypothetical protein n=1 Tax=Actinoplanes sp. NPDC051475 TaxID=3157225 RepID=UPI00344DAAF7
MKLLLIHGRAQGGKDPDTLRTTWTDALAAGLEKAGVAPLAGDVEIVLPFYGDLLDELTVGEPDLATRARGTDDPGDRFAASFILEMAERAGVTEAEILAEMDGETVEMGPQNWPWVLAAGRALSRRLPDGLASFVVRRLTPDVSAYLTRIDVRESLDGLVTPHLAADEPCVVVSHSLGTVVAYCSLIRHESVAKVPLLVTLGSPLGIDIVKAHLPRPLRRPAPVAHWLNATDVRDPVALYPRLDRDSFPAEIENISDVHNAQDDPHGITGYLSDAAVARRIAEALTG